MSHRHPTAMRSSALNTMSNAMGAKAFTAEIDLSTMLDQNECPLFISLPCEVRTRIFEFACTSSNDLDNPYEADRVYRRPGYKYRQKIELGLLQTCKRIYEEARLMPVSQAEHTFWMFGGPFRSLRTRKHAIGSFDNWRSSFNEEQQAAINYVHLFVQQAYLEQMGTRHMISPLNFETKVFTLTFRHSDWWSWESPPESTDRLGICPWLPERVSHQAMLSQPLRPSVEQMKATMIRGTWGWQVGQIQGLEVLRIEFETDILKKSQMAVVLDRAKHWKFPLHEANAVLVSDGVVRESEWLGQAHLKQDNTRALRHVGPDTGTEVAVAVRTYYVVEMTWRKRILSTEKL